MDIQTAAVKTALVLHPLDISQRNTLHRPGGRLTFFFDKEQSPVCQADKVPCLTPFCQGCADDAKQKVSSRRRFCAAPGKVL